MLETFLTFFIRLAPRLHHTPPSYQSLIFRLWKPSGVEAGCGWRILLPGEYAYGPFLVASDPLDLGKQECTIGKETFAWNDKVRASLRSMKKAVNYSGCDFVELVVEVCQDSVMRNVMIYRDPEKAKTASLYDLECRLKDIGYEPHEVYFSSFGKCRTYRLIQD